MRRASRLDTHISTHVQGASKLAYSSIPSSLQSTVASPQRDGPKHRKSMNPHWVQGFVPPGRERAGTVRVRTGCSTEDKDGPSDPGTTRSAERGPAALESCRPDRAGDPFASAEASA